MEFNNTEVAILENTVGAAADKEVRDLSELQLALVGGGIGDVVWG
jgi:hypothetical protein